MKDVFPNYNGMPLRWVWTYCDVESKPLMKVARYDSPNRKKEIIPYHPDSDGQWKVGAAPKPYPLFGLDSLNENKHSEFVFIVEGEKGASALRSLGFIAFTSSGGVGNAFSSDWTPCSGLKNVIIIPDNDEPGRKYCADIYSSHFKVRNFGCAKASGFNDQKRVPITNSDPFLIVESRELSRCPNSYFEVG